MVKSWQEHQNANDEDRNSSVCPPFADVARQQERAYDDEKGSDQEQHGGKGNGLIRDLRRTLLKLKVNVAIICAGKP